MTQVAGNSATKTVKGKGQTAATNVAVVEKVLPPKLSQPQLLQGQIRDGDRRKWMQRKKRQSTS